MEYINQSPYFNSNQLKRFILYRQIRTNKLISTHADISNAIIKKADIDNLNVKHDITLNNNPYLPIGIVLPYATTTAPQGWLVCNGQEVSKTTYASLWDVIGTTFGVATDPDNFKLPDLRGRVIVGNGTGSGLSDRNIGQNGGEETHTLTISEIPSHNHSINDPSHTHNTANTVQKNGVNTPDGIDNEGNEINTVTTITTTSSSATTGITINNTGGGNAHNIMQPFTVLNYIIKYRV